MAYPDKETLGVNQPLPLGVNQPLTLGVNQPLTLGVNQPLPLGVNQPLTLGVNQPLPLGVNQPLTLGVNQPLTLGVNQPLPQVLEDREHSFTLYHINRKLSLEPKVESPFQYPVPWQISRHSNGARPNDMCPTDCGELSSGGCGRIGHWSLSAGDSGVQPPPGLHQPGPGLPHWPAHRLLSLPNQQVGTLWICDLGPTIYRGQYIPSSCCYWPATHSLMGLSAWVHSVHGSMVAINRYTLTHTCTHTHTVTGITVYLQRG